MAKKGKKSSRDVQDVFVPYRVRRRYVDVAKEYARKRDMPDPNRALDRIIRRGLKAMDLLPSEDVPVIGEVRAE